MPPSLRKAVAAAIGGGAIAIASVLITGSSGNDGLEGVSYIPYKDIVGVLDWPPESPDNQYHLNK